MQKTLLSVGILALFGAVMTGPASAQMMCAPGQQALSTAAGGMMCGAPSGAASTMEMPSADKPAQQSSGVCPCCRNMAMMMRKPGGTQPEMPMEMPK